MSRLVLSRAIVPTVLGGNINEPVVRRFGVFGGHFEEDEVGQLFQVVAIANARIAQDVAEAPHFGDDGGGLGHGMLPALLPLLLWSCTIRLYSNLKREAI
jgi:hypothetical protein